MAPNTEYFEVYFSFIYFFIILCFVVPPRELVAAGLTVQNLFSNYLGHEDIDFVGYHLKRTSITLAIHSCFPLLYYIGLGISSPNLELFLIPNLSAPGLLFSLLCIGSSIAGLLIAAFWNINNWRYHPLTRDLLRYGSPWRAVASTINLEYRRLEKFSSKTGGTSIYVTDSWIIKCSTYKVHIAQQTDSHLSVVQSEEFLYNQETNQSAQFLKIKVMTIPPHEQSFFLNLNSLEYTDLKDRISSPLRLVRDVIVHQTLSERFLEAFKEQVRSNGMPEVMPNNTAERESCIGCMGVQANIVLSKHCIQRPFLPQAEQCQQCYCRPMWCLECMGKWFASRQNQQEPEGWMASTAPCPTCRAKFCMIDVFNI